MSKRQAPPARRAGRFAGSRRGGFTLVELLITITIIAMIASMMLFAMYSAQETARAEKTRALIAKLDSVIKNKWEAYRTRRVPLTPRADDYIDANGNGKWDTGESFVTDMYGSHDWNGNGRYDDAVLNGAQQRLPALRDMMRMELPERWSDICKVDVNGAALVPIQPAFSISGIPSSSVWNGYLRAVQVNPPKDDTNENAECLYLIMKAAVQEEGDDIGLFKPDNFGDADKDGHPEFVDGWGEPISFLRWAPGFYSELTVLAYGQVAQFTPGQTTPYQDATLTAGNDAKKADPSTASLFSMQSGAYQNCAIYFTDQLKGCSATISKYNPSTAQVQLSFPFSTSPALPFGGLSPAVGETFVIVAADPFDPQNLQNYPPTPIYPIATGLNNHCNGGTNCNLYPLIWSPGPDRKNDIATTIVGSNWRLTYPDTGSTTGLRNFPVAVDPNSGTMMGSVTGSAATDNIHNHLQGLK